MVMVWLNANVHGGLAPAAQVGPEHKAIDVLTHTRATQLGPLLLFHIYANVMSLSRVDWERLSVQSRWEDPGRGKRTECSYCQFDLKCGTHSATVRVEKPSSQHFRKAVAELGSSQYECPELCVCIRYEEKTESEP